MKNVEDLALVRFDDKVGSGVITVRGATKLVKCVTENGVYALVEVHRVDGSKVRFRVPTRSIASRLAEEAAMKGVAIKAVPIAA